jgi:hypothetical protein
MITFEITGTGYQPGEPITIGLTNGLPSNSLPTSAAAGQTLLISGGALPPVTTHAQTYRDGSFSAVVTARVGSYTLTVTGDKSNLLATEMVDLSVPSRLLTRSSSCTATVGLPTWN